MVDLPDILLPAGQYLDMFDSESETDVPSDSSDEELVKCLLLLLLLKSR